MDEIRNKTKTINNRKTKIKITTDEEEDNNNP